MKNKIMLIFITLMMLALASADPVYDHLTWSDEFNTSGYGPVDLTKWFHQTQLPLGGSWYNGEIQHYTNRMKNTIVHSGALHIIAHKETFTDQGVTKNYTSARLNSKQTFKYGRLEIKAKLPSGVGTWPAIWLLGKNIDEDGAYWDNLAYDTTPWPACGEIDIMEHWGSNQNFVQSATHTPSSYGGTVNHGGQVISTASTAYHVYALDWNSERLEFSVDSVVHYTYQPLIKDANTWPFDEEMYMILNIAIQPSIDPAFMNSSMDIDYVRYYQESPVAIAQTPSTLTPAIYPNPVNERLSIDLGASPQESITIRIYGLDGKLVKSYQHSTSYNIVNIGQLTDLSKGMYIVSYELNHTPYRFKIIKH